MATTRAPWLVGISLALLSTLGCTHPTPTQVLVVFDGDPTLVDDAAQLRIEVVNQEGVSRFWDIAIAPRDPDGTHFPVTLPLVPRNGDASRTFDVIADLIGAGSTVLARQRVHAGYVPGELRVARVHFSEACRDELCATGTTCRAGVCIDACVEPGPPGDQSIRACAIDAGPVDAALRDARVEDARVEDARVDASGEDAGVDAGNDAATLSPTACADLHADSIFCSGFERELDMDGWTLLWRESGGLINRLMAPMWRGRYVAEANITDSDSSHAILAEMHTAIVTTGDDLYVRAIVQVPSTTPPLQRFAFVFAGENGGARGGIALGLMPGLVPFASSHISGNEVTGAAIDEDEWVCIEGHTHFGETGTVELFVDRVPAGSITEDTRIATPATRFHAGVTDGRGQFPFRIYLDEVVVDDERIGCD